MLILHVIVFESLKVLT